MDVEFLNYVETPGEKYLGVAIIRVNRSIILRYKIIRTKTGSLFAAPASYKVPDPNNPSGKFIPAFAIDSSYDNQQINEMILDNVMKRGVSNVDSMSLPAMGSSMETFASSPFDMFN